MLRTSCLLMAGLALGLAPGLAAEPEDAFAAFAAGVESRVTEFKLKNGLEVIVYVDSSAPVVSTSVFYRVGSYHDPAGLTGLSHMTEHMTFQRSNMFKPGDFFRLVRKVGGSNNGFTPPFYTGYFETFSSDRWELALKLEAARMARCEITETDFASEHQVVAEEDRLGENMPMAVLWREFYATALLANPQRNTGWSDDINRYTADIVRDWYRRYYNPANAVLVIAGDIRPDDARRKAEKQFSGLKGVPVKLPDYYNIEPKQTGPRRVVVRRQVAQPLVMIGFHTPGIRDSNYIAGSVAAQLLAGGRTSRLYRALVNETGLASSVWGYNSVQRDPSLLILSISPRAESLIPRIEQVVERELARLRTDLMSERELQQCRNSALAGKIFTQDNIDWVGFQLAGSQIAVGSWRDFANELARINRMTREQVRDFCQRHLTVNNSTTGLLVNEKEER